MYFTYKYLTPIKSCEQVTSHNLTSCVKFVLCVNIYKRYSGETDNKL